MVRRDGAKVVPGGVAALGQQTLVPSPSDHPGAGRRLPHTLGHAVQDLPDAAAAIELDLTQHEPGREQVVVGVDQAGNHRRATEILNAGA